MSKTQLTLDDLKFEQQGIIKEINCQDNIKRRLLDLGLIKGTKVKLVLISPFKDPKAYEVRGTTIALREEDSQKILIESIV